MSNSARLQLGFSPLSKTIMLAKMRDVEGGRMRVGNDPGRDVTNEAAQLVWQLVMAEGGEIVWELDDGSRMVLKAEHQEAVRKGGSEMRKFKIIIETGIAGGDFEDEFEVDDDATPDEIQDEAKDIFFNYCNYSYHEIKDEEEEQNG